MTAMPIPVVEANLVDAPNLALVIIAFVVNLVVLAVTGTWKLSTAKLDILEGIAEQLGTYKRAIDDNLERTRRETGEGLIALRQKINEVELFNRDNFVRKETFNELLRALSSDVRGVRDTVESRLMRMEMKIDNLPQKGLDG